jgi:hypothetical protein
VLRPLLFFDLSIFELACFIFVPFLVNVKNYKSDFTFKYECRLSLHLLPWIFYVQKKYANVLRPLLFSDLSIFELACFIFLAISSQREKLQE